MISLSLSLLLFTCLSVSKDTGIISTECILQHIGTELVKHKLLATELWIVRIHRPETVVKCKRLRKKMKSRFVTCFFFNFCEGHTFDFLCALYEEREKRERKKK